MDSGRDEQTHAHSLCCPGVSRVPHPKFMSSLSELQMEPYLEIGSLQM